MTVQELVRIDCWVYREISHLVVEAFKDLLLPEIYARAARSVVFRERKVQFFRKGSFKLEEDPVEYFSFWIPREYSSRTVSFIAGRADLAFPGRGSVFSTEVALYRKTAMSFNSSALDALPEPATVPLRDLCGLTAIIRRGEGNDSARSLLQSGRALPIITFGTGVGLRDRLGLLRVTVPAEKEIVQAVVSKHDADANFDRMVKEANLDLPGKGFIYAFPILEGIIDTRMIRGGSLNIASIEQIVSAIDTMKGHAEWRRGSPAAAGTSKARQGNQAAWENLRIISREGEGGEKTRTALDLGAGGATRSRLRFFDPTGDSDRTVSHEREIIDLVVDRSTRENIIDSIELEEDILELSPVNRISAYRSGF